MKIQLHPVKRGTKASNRYCGPAALSILTGLDTKDTARLLRDVSGFRSIKGTSRGAMKAALIKLGINVMRWSIPNTFPCIKPLTFVQWERVTRIARDTDDTFLLVMGHHWAVIKGRRYACGLTKKPVGFKDIPHRKARVTDAWLLTRVASVTPAAVIPAAPPKPPVVRVPERIEAKRLAAQHGIELTSVSMYDRLNPEDDGVFVYPPDGFYGPDNDGDPYDDQHVAYDWAEVLEHVKTYAAAIEAKKNSVDTIPTPILSSLPS